MSGPDPVDLVFQALLDRCGTDPSSPSLTGPVCRADVAAALAELPAQGLDIVLERWTGPAPTPAPDPELGPTVLVPPAAEDELVDLMAALEQSVREAKASRTRHVQAVRP